MARRARTAYSLRGDIGKAYGRPWSVWTVVQYWRSASCVSLPGATATRVSFAEKFHKFLLTKWDGLG